MDAQTRSESRELSRHKVYLLTLALVPRTHACRHLYHSGCCFGPTALVATPLLDLCTVVFNPTTPLRGAVSSPLSVGAGPPPPWGSRNVTLPHRSFVSLHPDANSPLLSSYQPPPYPKTDSSRTHLHRDNYIKYSNSIGL